ncbi:hypothetical protein I7I50_00118 [Histoplasma capsulatum G186AR]|uniref:Uncharacterized protein n=1 Tax=Ajellomyces capsulatus TaxID=5037 RepID=A0A8H7YIZ3_AJECA|nr:hypothetical protein I7I52_07387 [Histoplasma capsulatum]QSS72311.1 hypothetical protein I7I50_00118 [Histoplasma capsulatum G186AR]
MPLQLSRGFSVEHKDEYYDLKNGCFFKTLLHHLQSNLLGEEIASEILAKKLSQYRTVIKSTESTRQPVPTMQRSYCPLKISLLPHLSRGGEM